MKDGEDDEIQSFWIDHDDMSQCEKSLMVTKSVKIKNGKILDSFCKDQLEDYKCWKEYKGQWSYGLTSLARGNVFADFDLAKKKCDELGKNDCGSIHQSKRSENLVYELRRGTKLDGKENVQSEISTWLRSRDCDSVDPEIMERSIQNEIRKDPFKGVKWKLNLESDCYSTCGGGSCPSYCGTNGFCCSGDSSLNGNCPKSAFESFQSIAPYPFGRHYCMNPEKIIKVPDWGENKEKNCLLDCNGNEGPCPGFCGSTLVNGFCCSKDQSGTLRCPQSAKFAVTSDSNSCVILNEIPNDDDIVTNELEIESDIDEEKTMLIDTPQWVSKMIKIHSTFDQEGKYGSTICSGFRVSFNQIITTRNCCQGNVQLQSGEKYIPVPNDYISLKRFDENQNNGDDSIANQFCSIIIPGTK